MQFVTHSNKLLNESLSRSEIKAELRILTAGRTREEKRRNMVVGYCVWLLNPARKYKRRVYFDAFWNA